MGKLLAKAPFVDLASAPRGSNPPHPDRPRNHIRCTTVGAKTRGGKVPEFALCVLALRHGGAGTYLDFSRPPVNRNAVWFRSFVVAAATEVGVDLRTWRRRNVFYDISSSVGPVLMTNHMTTDQVNRLFDSKPDRTVVTGANDFPDLPVDWEKARAYASFFRKPQSDRSLPRS
jgi:hypothetical protein